MKVQTIAFTVLAAFSLLVFCGCPAEVEGVPASFPETLIGTQWEWDSSYGLRTLEFDAADHIIFHNDHRDGLPVQHLNDSYTYNSQTGRGEITGEYPAGEFQITNNNQTMHFINFKNYGHGADFTRKENPSETSLTDTVFAGPDAEGKWATFAFVLVNDENKVYYFPDNADCYNGSYTWNSSTRSGAITEITRAARNDEAGTPRQAPGVFSLSADGKTIAFTGYPGQGARSFKRVRDQNAEDEEVPFTFDALEANLNGTVWAATAYRTKDWTTLTITATEAASGTIQVSHSFDCTSFPRTYTGYAYNTETTLSYIGPFKIQGNSFTFLDFYGHGGRITLKRMR